MSLRTWLFGESRAETELGDSEPVVSGGSVLEDLFEAMSGEQPVSEALALNVPAVTACLDFITGMAATVPFKLYEMERDGTREVPDDGRVRALNYDTGDLLNVRETRIALYRDMMLHGAGYAYIERYGNEVSALHYVDRAAVGVDVGSDHIFKTARILVDGKVYPDWAFLKLTRHTRDGVTGSGVLKENAKELATAWATMTLQESTMRGGGNAKGFLRSERKLSQPALDKLKAGFERLYSASKSRVVVLNRGIEFTPASNDNTELQMNETIDNIRKDVCTMFNVQPGLILGTPTQEALTATLQTAVVPLVEQMAAALNRDLLLETEKGKRFFEADTTQLLRGDMLARYQAYLFAAQAGWLGKNEIRKRENMAALPGLDVVGMNLADVLFDAKTGTYVIPNTGMAFKMDGDGVKVLTAPGTVNGGSTPTEPGTERDGKGGDENANDDP